MANVEPRLQRAIAELTGNESLLGMLEENAASEMLDWGIKMSTSIVNETDGMDDVEADETLAPKLKAVRSSLRSIGNWAAGKYVEADDRIQLRDKLLEHFSTILGEGHTLPPTEVMDELINQVDDASNTPDQLVLKLKQLIVEQNKGDL